MGPFAGGVIGAILPAVRESLSADLGAISWAVPAYMIPFAAFQLISGSISDRTSRRFALGIGFTLFVVASVCCAAALSIEWFLLGRFLQGAANAFTTPILVAATADLVPRERLGRTMGSFVSVNMVGGFAAPLVGGAFAQFDWRLVYVLTAGVALVLGVLYDRVLRHASPRNSSSSPGFQEIARVLASRGGIIAGTAAFSAQLATFGSSYLWSTYLVERWHLSLVAAGAVSSLLGLLGIVAAPYAGRRVEAVGPARVLTEGSVLAFLGGIAIALAPAPELFVLGVIPLGIAYGSLWAAMPSLVLMLLTDQRLRGTAVSINATFRFGASAVAPAMFTPIYGALGGATFLVGCAAAAVLPAVAAAAGRTLRDNDRAERSAGERT